MELHFNEATARLSIFEESLEYLIGLNGKKDFFLFPLSSHAIFLSVVEQKTLNENILYKCYHLQHQRHYTAEM